MSIKALHLDSDRRMISSVLAVSLVPAIWYVQNDVAQYGGDWQHLRARLITRAVLVSICCGGLLLMRLVRTRVAYSRAVFTLALAAAALLVITSALRPQGGTLSFRTPFFCLLAMYGAMPNSFWRQIAPPLLMSAGLAILRITWLTSAVASDINGDLLILVMMNLAGVYMTRRRIELERDVGVAYAGEYDARIASDRAFAELRTLRGIIPICSHCKQVRTDVGDWQEIERYVAANSDAAFSHGICPPCLDQHYSDIIPRPPGKSAGAA
ncbi:MAG: hypothetical protein ABJE47_01495 [bacterium]